LVLCGLLVASTAAATANQQWQAKMGTGGANGTAILRALSNSTGSLDLRVTKLTAGHAYAVSIRRGTCSSLGSVVATSPAIKSTSAGRITRTVLLTTAEISAIRAASAAGKKISLLMGTGSYKRCGPFSAVAWGGVDLTGTKYKAQPVGYAGGKLVLGEWQFPSSNLYFDNSFTTVEAMGIGLWSLWNVTADYKYFPQLTTMVPTVDNGGVTITPEGGMDVKIELIPGAQWSDGQPITCQDVADNVTWQMSPDQVGNVFGTYGWGDITSVDGGTGSSCVAHFKKQFGGYLGLWSPLLPSHYTKTVPVADAWTKLYPTTDIASGVYSGPYMPTK
jgi:ABC-type transport system substrate-binding protein